MLHVFCINLTPITIQGYSKQEGWGVIAGAGSTIEFSRDGETWEVMPTKLPAQMTHLPGDHCQVALDAESFWIGGGSEVEDGSTRAIKTGYWALFNIEG